jgi:hypothetical protein
MPKVVGRNLPLSLPRRFITDLVHFARQVPSVPVQRRMDLGVVVEARQAASPRPSWSAIFAKAYGFVSAATPELRRSYLSFPWPHLFESSTNVASIAVERLFGDENAVFFGRIRNPERKSLIELDQEVQHLKQAPIERIGSFRQALRLSGLPRVLRRLGWWVGLNAWARKRTHFFGTFGLSVYSRLGAASLHPLSPLTTTLNFGVIEPDGKVDVRLIYDHRVLDGAAVARALEDLERILRCEIVAELRYLHELEATSEPPPQRSYTAR